jgi:hypothetical protein
MRSRRWSRAISDLPGAPARAPPHNERTFGVPQQFFAPGIPGLLRDSESVLSGYLSLSSSAPHLFGDRLDGFAGEVRALLANRSAEGIFWDWPGDTEVVMARKPG